MFRQDSFLEQLQHYYKYLVINKKGRDKAFELNTTFIVTSFQP